MSSYSVDRFRSFRMDDDGKVEMMANFVAEITQETRYTDGLTTRVVLSIVGAKPRINDQGDADETEPTLLPEVEVEASDFPSMSWVVQHWGINCIIRPGTSVKDDLRTFFQQRSDPKVVVVYRHTGWAQVNGRRTYLHVGGGITKAGNNANVRVELTPELSRYNLAYAKEVDPHAAVLATLQLTELAPAVSWPLLAATIAPLHGPVDFAVHLSGRTGTFKSELVSLWQSHYGAGMDARHLPGSWASTGNAIEAQAYFAKDAVFVLDDFVPSGTSWQVRAMQATADRVIRAAGNQAGRQRMNDASGVQSTYYPRCLILSTGEDTPDGHSIRARMLILEMTPGDIEPKHLTEMQGLRPYYPATLAAYIQSLAEEPADLTQFIESMREVYAGIGHSRTPTMLARLTASVMHFLQWCLDQKHIGPARAQQLGNAAQEYIRAAGERQAAYLEDADPADQFTAFVRQVVGSGRGHFRTINGGIPKNGELLGWTRERSAGEMDTYKSNGPLLGWVDWNKDELYIDVTAGFRLITRAAGSELPLSKQTLFKRLKDSGKLIRVDEARQRNTVRVTADGHPRQVLCLSIADTLELQEVPQ